jgi:hypothetical protein
VPPRGKPAAARNLGAHRPLTPLGPQLLHWRGFGETEELRENAVKLWNQLHTNVVNSPTINAGRHWDIVADTNDEANQEIADHGRHIGSDTGSLYELMTPELQPRDESEMEVYLSAATLAGCSGPRLWCIPDNIIQGYGCTENAVCRLPTEQHGSTVNTESNILPGYCSAEVAHFPNGGEAPPGLVGDTGGGGGSSGGGGGGGGGGSSDGLSGGAIAGIVVGAVVVVGGAVAVAAGSGVLAVPALVGSEAEVLLI